MVAAGLEAARAAAGPLLQDAVPHHDSHTEDAHLCETVKVLSKSLQKPADGCSCGVKASRQAKGGVPSLTSTHGSRHAARWPELIRGCMAVTPVTTMQPFE